MQPAWPRSGDAILNLEGSGMASQEPLGPYARWRVPVRTPLQINHRGYGSGDGRRAWGRGGRDRTRLPPEEGNPVREASAAARASGQSSPPITRVIWFSRLRIAFPFAPLLRRLSRAQSSWPSNPPAGT